jgi:pimeloyl-ACP methyl ester carboxylesterase
MQALFLAEHDAWLRYHDLPGWGPACIYLHGLASAASADFPALIAQPALSGRRAVLVDLLGFGFSDRPEAFGYTLEEHARTVIALLDHLGLARCAVIGHSMGGSVAIVLTTLRPDLVGRLVVAEANLAPGPEEGSNAVFSRAVSSYTEDAFLHSGWKDMMHAMHAAFPAFAGQLEVADPCAVYRTASSLVADVRPSLGDQLSRASMPRTYVIGERSLANEDMAARAAALPIQGVQVRTVPNADHMMGLEKTPADFADLLAAEFRGNAQ